MEEGWRRDGGEMEEGWKRDGRWMEEGWRRDVWMLILSYKKLHKKFRNA